jgi:hypothetical protein
MLIIAAFHAPPAIVIAPTAIVPFGLILEAVSKTVVPIGPLLGLMFSGRGLTVKLAAAVLVEPSVPVTCVTPGAAVAGVVTLALITPVPLAVTFAQKTPAKVKATLPGAQPLPVTATVAPARPLDGVKARLGVTVKEAGLALALLPARSAAVTVCAPAARPAGIVPVAVKPPALVVTADPKPAPPTVTLTV